jgi:hypothetical protein
MLCYANRSPLWQILCPNCNCQWFRDSCGCRGQIFRCFFVSARSFRVNFDKAKRSFSRAANCILSHLQGHASEEVIFHLLRSKAFPIRYATVTVDLSSPIMRFLDFCVTRFVIKVLKSTNRELIAACMDYFDFALPSSIISIRAGKFKSRFELLDNNVCALAACLRS